jgi:hypothetical protein
MQAAGIKGIISGKMQTRINDGTVQYKLFAGEEELSLNPLVGKSFKISVSGVQCCQECGAPKVFKMGVCWQCFSVLARCDTCIVRPEICHFHKGTCRDESFAKHHCLIPHLVYFSVTSHLKVGITRGGNELIRWADQGAGRGVVLMEVPTRRDAGLVESHLKQYYSDRTAWQRMLKGQESDVNLLDEVSSLRDKFSLPDGAKWREPHVVNLNYPLAKHPEKVKSLKIEKGLEFSGTLEGIKGQYLIFDQGRVLNIRNGEGWEFEIIVS